MHRGRGVRCVHPFTELQTRDTPISEQLGTALSYKERRAHNFREGVVYLYVCVCMRRIDNATERTTINNSHCICTTNRNKKARKRRSRNLAKTRGTSDHPGALFDRRQGAGSSPLARLLTYLKN